MPPKHTGAPKRHFSARSGPRKTGPGTLDPISSQAGHSSSTYRSEPYNEPAPQAPRASGSLSEIFNTGDDGPTSAQDIIETQKAQAVPTVLLSGLPPDIHYFAVKELFKDTPLEGVHEIWIIYAPAPRPGEQRQRQYGMSFAIVKVDKTFKKDDVDSTISKLQNKYIWEGYRMSISSWVSSHLAEKNVPELRATLAAAPAWTPFGAVPRNPSADGAPTYGRVAPPSGTSGSSALHNHHHGFGGDRANHTRLQDMVVHVKPPNNLDKIKQIHRTIQRLLQHGEEFEEVLMSRPNIQKDERWSFLFDPYSAENVWYKFRFWELKTGEWTKRDHTKDQEYRPFDIGPIFRVAKEDVLPFQFCASKFDLVDEIKKLGYDDDLESVLLKPEWIDRREEPDGPDDDESQWHFLTPLGKAKLQFILYHLPKARKDVTRRHVARVVTFALHHAGPGRSEEIVDMLVRNVFEPVCWNPHLDYSKEGMSEEKARVHQEARDNFEYDKLCPKHAKARNEDKKSSIYDIVDLSRDEEQAFERALAADEADEGTTAHAEVKSAVSARMVERTESMFVGLDIISDLLNASLQYGKSLHKKIPALFEKAFDDTDLFFHLGTIEKCTAFGVMRTNRWHRRVHDWLAAQPSRGVFSKATIGKWELRYDHGVADGTKYIKKDEPDDAAANLVPPSAPTTTQSKGLAPGFRKLGSKPTEFHDAGVEIPAELPNPLAIASGATDYDKRSSSPSGNALSSDNDVTDIESLADGTNPWQYNFFGPADESNGRDGDPVDDESHVKATTTEDLALWNQARDSRRPQDNLGSTQVVAPPEAHATINQASTNGRDGDGGGGDDSSSDDSDGDDGGPNATADNTNDQPSNDDDDITRHWRSRNRYVNKQDKLALYYRSIVDVAEPEELEKEMESMVGQ